MHYASPRGLPSTHRALTWHRKMVSTHLFSAYVVLVLLSPFFRLPFFFEHYLTSLVPFGTPALIEMCFHVNLQVELCSSILVEAQLLSQN